MSDDYSYVSAGSLKLKKGLKVKKNKKNKHKIDDKIDNEKRIEKALSKDITSTTSQSSSSSSEISWMTETQRKFLQQQEKQKQKKILEKAEETHKDRVQKFNEKLENLSEFYDIPKISWTK